MANAEGDFIWYELLTSDTDAAARFYGNVLGWTTRAAGNEAAGDYRVFGIAGSDVGGMMHLPDGAESCGMQPAWLGYIGVDDVDASAAKLIGAGGRQSMPPTDIPGIGRFAMLADPQGAPFYIMRGAVDGTSRSFAQDRRGHCHWNELATSDQAAALDFYTGGFGWQRGDAIPMGDIGEYRFLVQNGTTMGAVMTGGPESGRPAWTFYFGVGDIDEAADRIREGGGIVTEGPAQVPGGIWVLSADDPQGARFGLTGTRRS